MKYYAYIIVFLQTSMNLRSHVWSLHDITFLVIKIIFYKFVFVSRVRRIFNIPPPPFFSFFLPVYGMQQMNSSTNFVIIFGVFSGLFFVILLVIFLHCVVVKFRRRHLAQLDGRVRGRIIRVVPSYYIAIRSSANCIWHFVKQLLSNIPVIHVSLQKEIVWTASKGVVSW